jgi:CBS domain-containing protein
MTTVDKLLINKAGDIWSLGPEATVFEALELMAEKNISGVLVLEGQALVGIFTERDYARKLVLKGRVSRNTHLKDMMTKSVLYVTPQNTVQDCMTLMTEKRIRHLPVMNDDELVGLLTIGDLVKQIISEQEATIHHLENYIVGSY